MWNSKRRWAEVGTMQAKRVSISVTDFSCFSVCENCKSRPTMIKRKGYGVRFWGLRVVIPPPSNKFPTWQPSVGCGTFPEKYTLSFHYERRQRIRKTIRTGWTNDCCLTHRSSVTYKPNGPYADKHCGGRPSLLHQNLVSLRCESKVQRFCEPQGTVMCIHCLISVYTRSTLNSAIFVFIARTGMSTHERSIDHVWLQSTHTVCGTVTCEDRCFFAPWVENDFGELRIEDKQIAYGFASERYTKKWF